MKNLKYLLIPVALIIFLLLFLWWPAVKRQPLDVTSGDKLRSEQIGATNNIPTVPSRPIPEIKSSFPFTFVIFGDSRKSAAVEETVLKRVDHARPHIIRKIAEQNPLFIINTGDLVYQGSDEDDWVEFEQQNKIFKDRNIPYYPVLGNHEYKGRDKKALAKYFQRFPHLDNQKWYSFQKNNCFFVMLDSNFDELEDEELDRQKQWLAEKLNQAEQDQAVDFIFACFHHPPFTNSKMHKDNKGVRDHFLPIFEKSLKLKFVFNGHIHLYERFKEKHINYIVTGGGGAPLMKLKKEDQREYQDEYKKDEPRGTHF